MFPESSRSKLLAFYATVRRASKETKTVGAVLKGIHPPECFQKARIPESSHFKRQRGSCTTVPSVVILRNRPEEIMYPSVVVLRLRPRITPVLRRVQFLAMRYGFSFDLKSPECFQNARVPELSHSRMLAFESWSDNPHNEYEYISVRVLRLRPLIAVVRTTPVFPRVQKPRGAVSFLFGHGRELFSQLRTNDAVHGGVKPHAKEMPCEW